MSDAIHEHRGHVSTFLGDGILAYFGALQPNPWQCDDAVRGCPRDAGGHPRVQLPSSRARGCRRSPWGSASTAARGWPGLIGSRERMEYAFVGRTVNLAARVQALTRIHKVDILVTEALRAELDTRFVLTPMPAEPVNGIAEPVVTYAVRETSAAAAPAAG